MPVALVLVAGFACGSPNPKILDATEEQRPRNVDEETMTEADKIRALIDMVRSSDATFIQSGVEHKGSVAASDLERRLSRVPAGIPTARQFIDRVGAGKLRDKEGDQVRLTDGTEMSTRDWFLARLADLEGRPAPAAAEKIAAANAENSSADETKASAAQKDIELGILDALTVVERSGLKFVAPARRNPKGEVKGKRKEYTATEFAEMLRKKWEFLGADIDSLDEFVEEIATDAFSSMEPYRVVHPSGKEEEFRPWLLQQLSERRKALAQGTRK